MQNPKAEEVLQYYTGQIEKFNGQLNSLQRRKSAFAWLRLGSIAAIIFAFYILWQAGVIYVFIASLILLIVFIRLVYADLKNHDKIRFTNKILGLYQKEIDNLKGVFPFENGSGYIDKEHPYSSDLDIFGEGSLFQYMNRTTSEPGADTLARFLTEKSSIDIITARQKAVSELRADSEWLKRMQTSGALKKFTNQASIKLDNWVDQRNTFITFKPWAFLRYLLPAVILTIIFLYVNGTASIGVLLITLLVFAIIAYQLNKVVAPIHHQLDDVAQQLSSLSSTIEMIENRKFKSPLLNEMKNELFLKDSNSSKEIQKIKRLLDQLDLRYNFVVSLPLNLLLLWNLQQVLELEKWKVRHRDHIRQWINVLAKFEAMNSLANFSFNHPDYVFPEVVPEYFSIKGEEIGHPLIPGLKRVSNPIEIPAEGKLMLVTGSNMAGKSTYLRSIGVNCVLAFCGAPVCAKRFSVSLVSLISSMRIADNLQESTSTFYAELKKLKVIIDHVNQSDKVFILLDEILRGTNSIDRHTGSKALIRQLIEKRSAAIIATHDLELAELKETFSDNILNYHFDVQVSNEELFFDYQLKPGICRSMNASILMKKIGIEI